MPRLFLLRHGIRGSPSGLTLLASGENLNLEGHQLCYRVGEYIRRHYGKPDFVYGDVTMARTVDSAISIGKGLGVDSIHLSRERRDSFFHVPNQTDNVAAEQILKDADAEIRSVKKAIREWVPTLKLADTSDINSYGEVTGLIAEENSLATNMLFSEASGLWNPLLGKARDEIARIHTTVWRIRGPTLSAIRPSVEAMLAGISHFLHQHELSVLVDHERNIVQLSQWFDKPFEIPGYPRYWVPACSGLLFTLRRNYIRVRIVYSQPKLTVIPLCKIDIPPTRGDFDLMRAYIG